MSTQTGWVPDKSHPGERCISKFFADAGDGDYYLGDTERYFGEVMRAIALMVISGEPTLDALGASCRDGSVRLLRLH